MAAPRNLRGFLKRALIRRNLTRNFTLILIAAALALAGVALAQHAPLSIRVDAEPSHLGFYVDGQYFAQPAAFFWLPGSYHVLSAPAIQEGRMPGMRYTFDGWYTGNTKLEQQGSQLIVTADPAFQIYRAVYRTQYLLRIVLETCPEDHGNCATPGSVFVDGARLTSATELWIEAGKTVRLEAIPNPGFVCAGWVAPPIDTGFTASLTMTGPSMVMPRFLPAQKVRLETNPSGFQILADRTPVTAPVTFDWGYGTVHSLIPVSPQMDLQGRTWVFQKWSDGGPATRAYKVPMGERQASLTAEFVPGARVTFATNPPGLKLRIDGRDDWYGGYNFSWGVGETHAVEAPAEQMDSNGRKWVFRGWSNGGAAAQEVTIAPDHAETGLRLTANYEALGLLTIQASAGIAAATVDGVTCALPCTVHGEPGSQIQLSVPVTFASGDDARFDFRGWSDGSTAAERTVTLDSANHTLSANYVLMNRLALISEPAGGALFHCEPSSADGFYEAGTSVAIRVEDRPGFHFRRFEGDLTGSFTPGVLAMSAPRFVRAVLEEVPYIAPAGVRNAAGETPTEALAPGSAITIFGANLAPAVELGPESPLAQAIAGVTVRMGERLLPLFFVSPEQINAQLPSDLEPGEYTLTVWRDKRSEVSATFTVARNAPGLFQNYVGDQAWALALHPDGSVVTPESPAKKGEVVTVYGTGFGPTVPRTLDGFAVPEAPAYLLADEAEVVAGEFTAAPQWIGLAPGRVAVNAFRFLVAPELPSGAVPLKLRVNGVESNSVLLAVE